MENCDNYVLRYIFGHLANIERIAIMRVSRAWHAHIGKMIGLTAFYKVDNFIKHAIEYGDAESLMVRPDFASFEALVRNEDALLEAAKRGHLNILKWAMATHGFVHDNSFATAIRYGHVHILDWLPNHPSHFYVNHTESVATLIWARKHNVNISEFRICPRAARDGNLEILQWIYDNGTYFKGLTDETCMSEGLASGIDIENAVKGNNLLALEWLTKIGAIYPRSNIKVKTPEMARRLLDAGCSKFTCMLKLCSNEEIIAYMSTLSEGDLRRATLSIARWGNIALFDHAISLGVKIGRYVQDIIVEHGNIAFLEANRISIEFNRDMVYCVVKKGLYDILDLFIANASNLVDGYAYKAAIRKNNVKMLDYLYVKGIPFGFNENYIGRAENLLRDAVYANAFDSFVWLIEHNYASTTLCLSDDILRHGGLRIISIAIEKSLIGSVFNYDEGAFFGHENNENYGCLINGIINSSSMQRIIGGKRYSVVKLLKRHNFTFTLNPRSINKHWIDYVNSC